MITLLVLGIFMALVILLIWLPLLIIMANVLMDYWCWWRANVALAKEAAANENLWQRRVRYDRDERVMARNMKRQRVRDQA